MWLIKPSSVSKNKTLSTEFTTKRSLRSMNASSISNFILKRLAISYVIIKPPMFEDIMCHYSAVHLHIAFKTVSTPQTSIELSFSNVFLR